MKCILFAKFRCNYQIKFVRIAP